MTSPLSRAKLPRRSAWCGLSIQPGCIGGWPLGIRTSKDKDGANDVAPLHGVEAFVDLRERQAQRDEFVELQAAVEIAARQPREIAPRPRAAVARTDHPLLPHHR